MIHILLIGAGTMGSVHAHAYSKMSNVKLVGIVDIRQEAKELCSAVNAQYFSSYEEAVKQLQQMDAVDVCVPTYLHKFYVKQAADGGKHVICEKPLAGNLQDAREMIDYCQAQQVHLYVGHVLRFFPEYVEAKRVIDRGGIGKTAVVRTSRVAGFPMGWNDWYADAQKSGGAALDLIIHDFDFLRWCYGEVERVFAKGLSGRELARKDYALVTLRFKNGVIAHVEGSWSHQAFTMKFEIAGTTGIIDYDSAKDSSIYWSKENGQSGGKDVSVPESPLQTTPYARELEHFISCMETGSKPVVTAEDAYSALEISLAAIESMKTARPVTLPFEQTVVQSGGNRV